MGARIADYEDGWSSSMRTQRLPQQTESALEIRFNKQHTFQHPWLIAMTVNVNADRHRLFQALTVPEYMETWISFPGPARHGPISATCTTENYRLVGGGDGAEICIAGSYRVSRRSKMVFTWGKGNAPRASQSLVTIRLLGDFARTTLRLTHSGLDSRSEYLWHRAFWEGSMGRLRSILCSGWSA
jgi:uncharacterized protein YndB with AHSA1/START domain